MKKWDLYWSPEGRKIATVEAQTARQAIRKAPQPYRKYLGEITAELQTNAYKAVITLKSEGWMLGGTREYESSAFESRSDAQSFAEQSKQVNLDRPGYEDAIIDTKIVPVYSSNPIPEAK